MSSVNTTTLCTMIVFLISIPFPLTFGQFLTTYYGSDFICDSSSKTCPLDSILCDYDQECNIQCINNNPNAQNSSINKETDCNSNNPGCCSTVIYCPINAECNIDCSHSCNNIIINASLSIKLTIYNCGINCDDMQIACPYTSSSSTDPSCIIFGDSDIDALNIYSKNGFHDVSIDLDDNSLTNSIMHCAGNNVNSFCSIHSTQYDVCQFDSLSLPCDPSSDHTTTTDTPDSLESVESAESLDSKEAFNITANNRVLINHKEKRGGHGIVYVQINDDNATFFLVVLVAAVLLCGLTAVFCVYCSIWIKKKCILKKKNKKRKPPGVSIHNVFAVDMKPGSPLPESIIACTPRMKQAQFANNGLMLNLSNIDQKVAMTELKKRKRMMQKMEANADSQDSNDDSQDTHLESVEIALDVDEFVIECARRKNPMHPIKTDEMMRGRRGTNGEEEEDPFYKTVGVTMDEGLDDISL